MNIHSIFHPCWWKLGVVDELMIAQLESQMGDDEHVEHWEVVALDLYADELRVLSKLWIQQFVECMQNHSMNPGEGLCALVSGRLGKLDAEAFEYVAKEFILLGDWAARRINRYRLKRLMELDNEIDDETIIDFVKQGDTAVHEMILLYFDTRIEVLDAVIKFGSKKIAHKANLARARNK